MDQSSRTSSLTSYGHLLSEGELIGGRFAVEAFLRQDFAGDVYLARDSQSERLVECLMIHLPPERVKRLLALRETISEVKLVNLKSFANTYGIGKQAGFGYMVRQQLEGRTLTDYLNHRLEQGKPFKQRALCSLLIEMIQGLDALSQQEPDVRSHGLLRPSAILVQNKSKPRVRMTDLGLHVLREDLIVNPERDAWTLGCVPELRGEPTPQDPDLYSLGALLYQMTHLKPFDTSWAIEFVPMPTFERLGELIQRCTTTQDLSLLELKEALKEAARAQVEEGGLTDDLSQLQERLHKIISREDEGLQRAPQEQLGAEESLSGVYEQGVDERAPFEAGDVRERALYQTPMPMSFQTPAPEAARAFQELQETRRVHPTPPPSARADEPEVDMSHFSLGPLEQELRDEPEGAASEPLLSSSQTPEPQARASQVSAHQGEALPSQDSQDELLSSTRPADIAELLAKVETFTGAELMPDDEELASIRALKPPAEPVAPPPPPPPPPPKRAPDPNAARWLVMRNGIDYGPYNQEQLTKQLFSLEISPETELCDIESGVRAELAEFDEMAYLLSTWAAKRSELVAEQSARERRARLKRQGLIGAALIASLTLSVGGYLYGPELYESTLPPPAEIKLADWVPPMPTLSPLERLEESPELKAERVRQQQAARARRAAIDEARAMAQEAREASTVEVDLNGKSVGRAFSQALFQKALKTRLAKLEGCIKAEMSRSPSVSTFKVSVTVQPSGRFLNARLQTGSDPGQRCVFRALRNLKMEPFDGSDRTITQAFKVR